MKICIPTQEDKGMESQVFEHFGSAQAFIIYDTETKEVTSIANADKEHEHGNCNPLASFGENKIDIIIVSGMGSGALGKLLKAGVRVFRGNPGTAHENIETLTSNGLPEFKMKHSCCGNHSGGGCCH